MPVSDNFRRQLEGYGLTTAEFFYSLPDAPWIIGPYSLVRQFHDIWPEFPELRRFLEFWRREIQGPLHSVRVAHQRLITPTEIQLINGGDFRFN
ncbi:hypothetical protein COU18_03640 [Candidatus Kaiserbacteria bacterium CG10_big_fil_rev_8_21_14_0_10_51_14]|uniref:Protein usg n=1 Tax=Candidatus Kaiserbacteria bacterium CG10_big_fil_rev_8_21_14_0_10_51_14 TaxID=1974610 RepID=A0A2H0UBE4_9BACT|nr:MAG: hypothetical protein COU18_03640 [Candidatus Kaiserbacteria bacterium CG10_big_fil_rev_8_21_14_0_10_51_14]